MYDIGTAFQNAEMRNTRKPSLSDTMVKDLNGTLVMKIAHDGKIEKKEAILSYDSLK